MEDGLYIWVVNLVGGQQDREGMEGHSRCIEQQVQRHSFIYGTRKHVVVGEYKLVEKDHQKENLRRVRVRRLKKEAEPDQEVA